MATEFDRKANAAIKADVRMISGCHDIQTSADVSNVGNFRLPNPAGRAGGACTAALLQTLYNYHANSVSPSWVELLRQMRVILRAKSFKQVPQLTSSHLIDVTDPMNIVNPKGSMNGGTKRAVLIGINYVGQTGQLSGCHNDVGNMKDYLINVHQFQEYNITVLMDDGRYPPPTYNNIMNAFGQLARSSQDGDTVFCHYSGHGGRLRDDNGDEEDGYDETLIPVDFKVAGQIRDDDLLKYLVRPMAAGVTMTCLMDCCHSGTVLDLPYRFTADGDVKAGMQRNESVNMDFLLGAAGMALFASALDGGEEVVDCCCCFDLIAELLGD